MDIVHVGPKNKWNENDIKHLLCNDIPKKNWNYSDSVNQEEVP